MSKFKTLKIGPMKEILHKEGKAQETGITQALSKCRACYRDYRKNGLFGKENLKGIYFFKEHTRGNAAKGTIKKVYNVASPPILS
jgi:hypothetical protein